MWGGGGGGAAGSGGVETSRNAPHPPTHPPTHPLCRPPSAPCLPTTPSAAGRTMPCRAAAPATARARWPPPAPASARSPSCSSAWLSRSTCAAPCRARRCTRRRVRGGAAGAKAGPPRCAACPRGVPARRRGPRPQPLPARPGPPARPPRPRHPQVSISGQALVFVVRTVRHSFMDRAGSWTYIAFFMAQVRRRRAGGRVPRPGLCPAPAPAPRARLSASLLIAPDSPLAPFSAVPPPPHTHTHSRASCSSSPP